MAVVVGGKLRERTPRAVEIVPVVVGLGLNGIIVSSTTKGFDIIVGVGIGVLNIELNKKTVSQVSGVRR